MILINPGVYWLFSLLVRKRKVLVRKYPVSFAVWREPEPLRDVYRRVKKDY